MRCFSTLQAIAALSALALLACREPEAGQTGDGPEPDARGSEDASAQDAAFPPPDGDLVAPVGSASALDLGAWNIENFPCGQAPGCRDSTGATIETVADLVTSLEIDLLAVEEIADTEAFDELNARLPDYEGLLSPHTYGGGEYQKVGVLYRTEVVTVSESRLLFEDRGYEFPRPPLELRVALARDDIPLDFTAIIVHLKAGTDPEDRSRRQAASELLEAYVSDLVDSGDPDVIVLGDFNNEIDGTEREVLAAWLDRPDRYTFVTEDLSAEGASFSFVPGRVLLDHIIITTSLADEADGGGAIIPRLDQTVVNYVDAVSDHLPVAKALPIF